MWHTGGNPGIGMKVKRCVQLSIGCWNAFLLELFEITVRQFAWQTAVEIVGSTKYDEDASMIVPYRKKN